MVFTPLPSVWFDVNSTSSRMNIDYTLEPIGDQNVAKYFHDGLDFNSYAKLFSHFKNITFTPGLCIRKSKIEYSKV